MQIVFIALPWELYMYSVGDSEYTLMCPFRTAGATANRIQIRKLINLLVFITDNIQLVTLISF